MPKDRKYNISCENKTIKCVVSLPASKSISNRALIIRALSYSWFKINNLSDSSDTIILNSVLNSNRQTFNLGNAGTAMRFLAAFLSKIVGEWVLTGTERMKNRPIAELVNALNNIGANITYLEKEGFPPLKILGSNLTGTEVKISGEKSSQFISALLMIAPTLLNGLKIQITDYIASQPYVDMTLNLMKYFGVYTIQDEKTYIIEHQEYSPKNITVEPDWSAASYWYEIAAFSEYAEIVFKNLTKSNFQGDSILSKIYTDLGIKTAFLKSGTKLTKTNVKANFVNLDLSNYPDIVPSLIVVLSFKKIHFKISGINNLKLKESNRIEALIAELKKFNIFIKEVEKGTLISVKFPTAFSEKTIEINTFDDHRIAMAFAPVAILLNNIIIHNPTVVKKSYPKFWEDIAKGGINYSIL